MSNAALDDNGKAQVVASFLGTLMQEMKERNMPSDLYTVVATRAIQTCSSALEQLKNYDKPLTKAEAQIFVEAYSLGSIQAQ